VDFGYARGVSQYGFRDLNLATSGGFTLPSEANRPVFVAPDEIVPSTGAISSRVSRVDSNFAQVLQIRSDLASETKQMTVSLGGVTRNGVMLQLSYTWSNVRDESSQSVGFGTGRFGGSSTSGNPNVPEWGRSSYERRHSFLATVSYPIGPSVDITGIGRLMSGAPFTPMVASDINGDGAANDQAFVFDPATSPGMAALLASAPAGVRSCLTRQIGTIAQRNSCLGPWSGTFDLQLNYRPGFLGIAHRVTVSITTMNLLHGVDQLLHGADGLKGWGLQVRPDDQLLYVTGFDAARDAYMYAVNGRFGATDPGSTAFRQPFQIGIQVRATFGPDRARDALLSLRGAGGGGGGFGGGFGGGMRGGFGGGPGGRPGGGRFGAGGGFTGEDFLARFRSLLINPADLVLQHADSIGLSRDQIGRLAVLRDSLTSVNDSVGKALQAEIDSVGSTAGADPRAMLQAIRPRMQQAIQNVREQIKIVRDLLTKEQWNKLPERIRRLGEQPAGPGMRRPPGG
jgi:hypothetical protein